MARLTDSEFADSSRAIALGILGLFERKQIPDDQVTGMLCAVLLEVLAQRLGGMPQAVERLRLLADITEAQALGDSEHVNKWPKTLQ